MIHFIYHIPERRKIGVTDNLQRRMMVHRWTGPYTILETHEDPQIAGDREWELQEEYGYEKDLQHYTTSIKCGKAGGEANKKLTNQQAREIRNSSISSRKLAKEYNVSQRTIILIKHNKTYVDV